MLGKNSCNKLDVCEQSSYASWSCMYAAFMHPHRVHVLLLYVLIVWMC